eukprot:CAMPEP_0178928430 /NCGR_PEP_ID=MMETSP0786-20121207/19899_1 /TAXON_ID=186022 /ORGANISM="Thalassionema frauenfeldii, Strain CCMP 1798" /LENGTH=220 /DNA_ID=CAMNT_0020604293 /DNA_START=562 /DNA_END=1224 /DNA_ORIENTATION=-
MGSMMGRMGMGPGSMNAAGGGNRNNGSTVTILPPPRDELDTAPPTAPSSDEPTAQPTDEPTALFPVEPDEPTALFPVEPDEAYDEPGCLTSSAAVDSPRTKCLSNEQCGLIGGKCKDYLGMFLFCDNQDHFGPEHGAYVLCDGVILGSDGYEDIVREGSSDDDCIFELSDAIFDHPSSECESNAECAGSCRIISGLYLACDNKESFADTYPKLCDEFDLT